MGGAEPTVISVVGASKRYRPPVSRFARRAEHVALRDVDLEVHRGETVGVLGHNGAGKTTLLRMLGGVTKPTDGRVRVVGRIAPLISVGVGFHQELSGRENVLLNGSLLGLTRRQLDERYDSIIEFSELSGVLGTPVKFYSSGMMMRLAFSVAMHVDPEVLLVDEVLAVGDLAFQLKCLERMRVMQRGGTTIVMVSHSLHAIRLLSSRAVVMDHGRVAFDGPPDRAVAAYLELLGRASTDDQLVHEQHGVRLSDPRLLDERGERAGELNPGDRYELWHRLAFDVATARPQIEVTFVGETGSISYQHVAEIGPPEGYGPGDAVDLRIPFTAAMGAGTFRISLRVLEQGTGRVLAEEIDRTVVYRKPAPGTYGIAELDARIRLGGVDLSDHAPVQIGEAP